MSTVIKGDFSAGIPVGMPKDVKVGDILPEAVTEKVIAEGEARIEMNITDPSGVRPFIDQPIVQGQIPREPKDRASAISRLLHEYRNANPLVIHAAAIMTPYGVAEDDTQGVSLLTDMFYKCQSAFHGMMRQLQEEKILLPNPKLASLVWENIGFPRLAGNIHILNAIMVYVEQHESALVIQLVFVYDYGEACVYSTRYPM